MSRKGYFAVCMLLASMLAAVPVLGGCNGAAGSPDILPHLISTPETDPVRPIDAFETAELSEFDGELDGAAYRERVDELYNTVVIDGKKPLFRENDPVENIYIAAREVLDTYILNAWHDGGEYNIVHTIHDWLAANIEYDFELYNNYVGTPSADIDDPAFGIDGVFLNRRAVCDGLSRAFCFLAAMEGVDCSRETGSYAGVAHAWNRVRVDGAYYNIDVTADCANYQVNGSGYSKQISHGYFLLSDNTFRTFSPDRHEPADITPIHPALRDFEYYKDKTITIGGTTFPCVVSSADELFRLFDAISAQKGSIGKIEVQLKFDGKIYVNDSDMYADEIRDAYARLKNPDFRVTATQKPYFRYPNGVYLFLMYK